MELLLIFSLLVNFLLLIWNFKLIDDKIKIKNKWYTRYSQLKKQSLKKDLVEEEIKFKDSNNKL